MADNDFIITTLNISEQQLRSVSIVKERSEILHPG